MAAVQLDEALEALKHETADPASVRAAIRAADNAEVAALEAPSDDARDALMRSVGAARKEIAKARAELRRTASTKKVELLSDAKAEDKETAAEAVARDINESLRRSTGVVTQEVARSNAAGQAVADSGHTMRKTRDTHKSYGKGLKDGRAILKELHRAERRANLSVKLSFAFLLLVSVYVTYRRAKRSAAVALVVRPMIRGASRPFFAIYGLAVTVRRRISSKRVPRNISSQMGEERRSVTRNRDTEQENPPAKDESRRTQSKSQKSIPSQESSQQTQPQCRRRIPLFN